VDPVVPLHPSPEADECCKTLPWIEPIDDLALHDPVRLPHHIDTLPRDFTDHPDGEARSRKRHAVLDLRRETESPGQHPDLVLVKVPERLDHLLELDLQWHATHVVVALYPALALDPVRINRPLEECAGTRPACFPLEDAYETFTDGLAFLFGVHHSFHGCKELVGCRDDVEVQTPEHLRYALCLTFPHQARVDVYRFETVADSPGGKGSTDGTVDTAREGHDYPAVTCLPPDLLHGLVDEFFGVDHSFTIPTACSPFFVAHARTKPRNGGEGRAGRDLNSGWNWVAMKKG